MGTIQTEAEHRRLFDDAMERHMGKRRKPMPHIPMGTASPSFEQLIAMLQSSGGR